MSLWVNCDIFWELDGSQARHWNWNNGKTLLGWNNYPLPTLGDLLWQYIYSFPPLKCKMLWIITPYHPQVNGSLERSHKPLVENITGSLQIPMVYIEINYYRKQYTTAHYDYFAPLIFFFVYKFKRFTNLKGQPTSLRYAFSRFFSSPTNLNLMEKIQGVRQRTYAYLCHTRKKEIYRNIAVINVSRYWRPSVKYSPLFC